jgi:hypothetical protein
MLPRSSGKNVFDFSITFGAPPCTAQSETVNGTAVAYPLANGKKQFAALAYNPFIGQLKNHRNNFPSTTFATAFFCTALSAVECSVRPQKC